jgi:tetratricopeptide (TPR) repeat protein
MSNGWNPRRGGRIVGGRRHRRANAGEKGVLMSADTAGSSDLFKLHGLTRLAEALASYDAALAIRPEDADTLHRRGDVLRLLSRCDEALASCEAALAIRPDMAEAHNNHGLILEELRRLPEALASFAKAQELAPNYAQAHWNEAALRLLTGEFLRG